MKIKISVSTGWCMPYVVNITFCMYLKLEIATNQTNNILLVLRRCNCVLITS